MHADPYFAEEGGDLDDARELFNRPATAVLYPGNEHLFTDSSQPSYDTEQRNYSWNE